MKKSTANEIIYKFVLSNISQTLVNDIMHDFNRALIDPIDLSKLDWFDAASMTRSMSARGRAIIGLSKLCCTAR